MSARVEEKLFQNRYRVDAGHPHIAIKNPEHCATGCEVKQCTTCCPAGCYTMEGNGRVVLITDGCLECGTCYVICHRKAFTRWRYPRGGFGVAYRMT